MSGNTPEQIDELKDSLQSCEKKLDIIHQTQEQLSQDVDRLEGYIATLNWRMLFLKPEPQEHYDTDPPKDS